MPCTYQQLLHGLQVASTNVMGVTATARNLAVPLRFTVHALGRLVGAQRLVHSRHMAACTIPEQHQHPRVWSLGLVGCTHTHPSYPQPPRTLRTATPTHPGRPAGSRTALRQRQQCTVNPHEHMWPKCQLGMAMKPLYQCTCRSTPTAPTHASRPATAHGASGLLPVSIGGQ